MTTDQPESTPAAPIRLGAAPTVRVANKAIIRDGDRLLVNVMRGADDGVTFYMSAGGGQEWGEDRIEALKRECREELGCEVEVDGFAFLRTYIGKNHAFASYDGWFHQEEAYWFCHLAEGAVPGGGHILDEQQVGVAWVSFDELRRTHGPEGGAHEGAPVFTPHAMLDWLDADPATRPLYLGDCI